MSESSTYLTIRGSSEGLYKEKGSKFIGIAHECYSEDQAKELLSEWRKQHHQARHLCYAYRFGVDKSVWRANDDGEPGNSAGPPILGQIEAYDLTNVLIGVVRYYGGTKLGVGGLINAYRTAAKEAIENGTIEERELHEYVEVHFGYEDLPHVMNVIKQSKAEMLRSDFELDCTAELKLPMQEAKALKEKLEQFETLEITLKGIY